MKHILIGIIGFLLISTYTVEAKESFTKEVIAGIPESFPPHLFFNQKTGHPDGFGVDVLNAVARQCGLKITYKVFANHQEIRRAITEGKIDINPNTGITPERRKFQDYTAPYETINIHLYVRESELGILSPENIKTKLIGVRNKNKAQYVLEDQGHTNLKLFESFDLLIMNLLAGEIDIIALPESYLNNYLTKMSLLDRVAPLGKPLAEIKRGIGVAKGHPELLQQIDTALKKFINSEEFKQIYQKWYGKPKSYWTARKVLVFMSIALTVTILFLFWWRYRAVKLINKRLQSNENILKKCQEIGQVGSWHLDRSKNIFTWSDELYNIFGLTPESFGGTYKAFLKHVHPDDRKRVDNEYRQAVQHGLPYECIHRIIRPDGEVRIVWGKSEEIFDEMGNATHSLGFIQDITRQKEVENMLVENEARFRMLFDHAPVPYQSLNFDGHILEVNQAWLTSLGYAKEEIIGRSFGDFLSPEMAEHFKYNFPRFKDKGEVLGIEFELRKKNGSFILARFNGRIGYDQEGNFKQTHCTFEDITLVRKAEKERDANEERLLSLLNLHDKKTLQEKDLLDYALEEAVRLTESGCGYLHLVEEDNKHLHLNLWSHEVRKICAAEKQQHYPLEEAGIWADCVRQRKPVIHNDYPNNPDKKGYPDGHFPIKRHMSIPVFDGNKIMAIVGVGNKNEEYNQTDVRQLQLFFTSTWNILKEKRFSLEKEKIAAQLQQAQKMEAIGTLAGGIAHDFNNILSLIIGYSEMAKEDAPPSSQLSEEVDKVLKAGYRARDLVKQILTFSRQTKIERTPLNISPLIKEGLKMLRSSIPTTITISEKIDKDVGIILADPTQVHQVFMNICTNAYHAMEKSGGVLVISLKNASFKDNNQEKPPHLSPGNYVELTVSDTGKGIAPEIMSKIFDPYFTTKEAGKGTGMGLSISHGIVAEYGGSIVVESRLSQGTSFHVYFPVIEGKATSAEYGLAEIHGGAERVLLVDDEPFLAEMGEEILARLGYLVTVSTSSKDALRLFKNNPQGFDVVVTDQTMPELTGSELAMQLLLIRSDIPIILCTGYTNLIDETSAKAIGIKEFAFKPLDKEKLATLVRKVLDERNISDHSNCGT